MEISLSMLGWFIFVYIAFFLVLAGALCYDMDCRTQQHMSQPHVISTFVIISQLFLFQFHICHGKNIPLHPCRKHLGLKRRSFTRIRTRIIKVGHICPLLNLTCNSMPLVCLFFLLV